MRNRTTSVLVRVVILASTLSLVAGIAAQEHKTDTPTIRTQKQWITYKSVEGRYSVSLPDQPNLSTQESATASGDKVKQYLATTSAENVYLMVAYCDYASGITFSLDDARDGMLQSVKGTLISEEAISLGGSPGKQIKLAGKTESGLTFFNRARLYDVSRRIYILQCLFETSDDSASTADQCEKFFDSFKARTGP